jgi:two-component system, chemotaxis family, chemotaxis protein CheY
MRKVLIAEDEKVLLNVLKERFEDEGWKVSAANDGEEALEKLKKAGRDGFDLLILDLLMPKKDGFGVLEDIKDNAELIDLPIIVLSNLGSDEDIKRAMKMGADDYYVKSQHPMSEIVEKAEKFSAGGHTLNKRVIKGKKEKEDKSMTDQGDEPVKEEVESEDTQVNKPEEVEVNQEIINFIKESHKAGASDEEIKAKLKEAGWLDKDVNMAFDSL